MKINIASITKLGYTPSEAHKWFVKMAQSAPTITENNKRSIMLDDAIEVCKRRIKASETFTRVDGEGWKKLLDKLKSLP